jgi:hypothetical protein
MLIPLTRETFERLVPAIATGAQYSRCWGKLNDILQRVLISFIGVVACLFVLGKLLGEGGEGLVQILAIVFGFYWLWSPIYWASIRNAAYRRLPYSGFFRGKILEVFVTDELIGEEQTVNPDTGELVIIENRERRINLEIGDRSGFVATVQAPLKRTHKALKPGQIAELIVLSKQPNLSRIDKYTDAYIPSQDMWIGDYPYIRRDEFRQVRLELGGTEKQQPDYRNNPRVKRIQRRRR